jgi:glutamine synthetase
VFIGKHLTEVLDELENVSDGNLSPEEKTELKLNVVGKIPEILLDNTDRNRTSPFAFTGNKFEFRAVGSSANCAKAMTILNMIVSEQLRKFKIQVDELIEKGIKKDDAIFNVLRELIKASKKIRFEGDGYSDEWVKDAKKRGLNNFKTTPEALKAQVSKETFALYEKHGIMNKVEVEARYEIELEEYIKKIQIEGRILGDIARNHVIPTAINYQTKLIENVQGLKDIFGNDYTKFASEQVSLIKEISGHIGSIMSNVEKMTEERKKANKIDHADKRADVYCNKVKPLFDDIRYACDKLELMIDDELWPLTKYRELLFTR